MADLDIEIGKRIRQKRREMKLTQEKLAEMVNINAQYLSRVERGVARPSLELLYAFAETLNCSVYVFLPAAVERSCNFLSEELTYRMENCSDTQRKFISDFLEWYLTRSD